MITGLINMCEFIQCWEIPLLLERMILYVKTAWGIR